MLSILYQIYPVSFILYRPADSDKSHGDLPLKAIQYFYLNRSNWVTAFTIEQATGPLDLATFNPMVSLTKKLPNKSDFLQLSYPELREHFESITDETNPNSALFIAKRRMAAVGHTVGLAGVRIEEDPETAVLTELVVDDRARGRKIGWELLRQTIDWSHERGAKSLEVSPPPAPNSAAEALLREMGFDDQHGLPRLDLENSPFTKD